MSASADELSYFTDNQRPVEDFCQIKNPFPVGFNLFCICLGRLHYFESVCVFGCVNAESVRV